MAGTGVARDRDPLAAAVFAAGLVGAADLGRAEEEAAVQGRPLGEVLLRLSLIDETNLAVTNALRLGHLYVELDDYPIDPEAVNRLPPVAARRMRALPIDWDEGRLVVAMSSPSDVVARDDLRLLTGAEIKPVAVTASALRDAIERVHPDVPEGMQVGGAAVHVFDDAESLEADLADAPAVRILNALIGDAIAGGASDIHIEPGATDLRVRYRIDGVLLDVRRLARTAVGPIVSRLKIMASLDISDHRLPQDGRITATIGGRRADLRVATMPTIHGEQATVRILDRSSGALSLEDLGLLPEELQRYRALLRSPSGTILATGPTGSGKSTTLYASLAETNTVGRKLVTIEDPVEYRIDGVTQMQVNTKAGLTFATALRAILRADPDVVLVGEIRDPETAGIAIEAALTGHVVLSTLHTSDAASAAIRLVEMGIEPYLIATALDGVVAQRLARVVCEACRRSDAPSPADRAVFEANGLAVPGAVPVVVGCATCSHTGFRGRVALAEVMPVSEALEGLVAEGARADRLRAQAVAEGMRPLLQVGLAHVVAGRTTVAEVLRVAS